MRAVLFSKQTTVCREINTTFKIHSNNIEIKERQKQSNKRQGGKNKHKEPMIVYKWKTHEDGVAKD